MTRRTQVVSPDVVRYQAGLRTEARIIEAAGELLGEVGLEATTLKAICDRAGVKAGSFYNLFRSKDEVVLRVLRQAITAVDPDPEGETDTLEQLVDAYVGFFTEQSALAQIYLQIAVKGAVTNHGIALRVLRGHEARVDRFRVAMMRERSSLETTGATILAELLVATLNGLAFRWSLDRSFSLRDHARTALANVVQR